MNKNFRAFFAIEISDEIKNEIIAITKNLQKELDLHKKSFNKIRWTKADNLHITLRFLGNINETQYENIITDLNNTLKEFSTFELELGKLVLFPSNQNPRMFVLKIGPNETLNKIWQAIDNIAIKNNIKQDNHPFTPHLTLCRFELKKEFLKIIMPVLSKMSFKVGTIKLFRSEPSTEGSQYTLLNNFLLKTEKQL